MAKPASDLEARVTALEKALMTVLVHLPAAFFDAQAAADAKTKRVLSDLENRLAAGATLARVLLPEEAYDAAFEETYDAAFEEWEGLPRAPKERWAEGWSSRRSRSSTWRGWSRKAMSRRNSAEEMATFAPSRSIRRRLSGSSRQPSNS